MNPHLYLAVAACVFLALGCQSNEGMTALLLAAQSGDEDALTALLSDGAKPDRKSNYGWTGLIFAASEGHRGVVNSLLNAGADPNILSEKIPPGFMATRGGYPPTNALREAIKNQHYTIANTLLDRGANTDPVAFSLAGGVGNIPLMARFIKLGADVNQSSDSEFYRSPLSAAARAGKLGAVQWLISHGADPNMIAGSQTALGKAVSNDQVEMVQYLLKNGANPNLVFNSMKDTALYVAATKYSDSRNYDQNLAIIKLLLAHGADPTHRAYGDNTATEFVKIQRNNGLKYLQDATDPKISKRHENSLKHKDAIISLLER